jgi:hypothetical protein
MISIHFAGQMNRPLEAFPDLREEIALNMRMVLLVATGMWQRFGPWAGRAKNRYNPKMNRLVYTRLISAFYIIKTVHAIINLI